MSEEETWGYAPLRGSQRSHPDTKKGLKGCDGYEVTATPLACCVSSTGLSSPTRSRIWIGHPEQCDLHARWSPG